MAKKQEGSSSFKTQESFSNSLVTDATGPYLPESAWTYARNAINNSVKGDSGTLSTEPSNVFCTQTPFVIIGSIFIEADKWVIFSSSNFDSEIGIFYETGCKYEKLVRDKCLNFNSDYLIQGISKPTEDCSYNIYWDDDYNLSRVLNISKVPWIQECVVTDGCVICTDTTKLDCDKIRLDPLLNTPTITLSMGTGVGQLFNGTYQVLIAYMLGNVKVSDWLSLSNYLTLFSHNNTNKSIDINIKNLDLRYDYYEVCLLTTINLKTVAYSMGVYNIRNTKLSYDYIDIPGTKIALTELTLITPVPKKTSGIYRTGNYAVRTSPTFKFNFNYQPLANKITSFWQSVEYKNTYYKNGGTNVGYMRDEVYAFFIRWIYDTGDKSPTFHIPGKAATQWDFTQDNNASLTVNENDPCPPTTNIIEPVGDIPAVFQVYNTAIISSSSPQILSDGGIVVAEGKMGYWQSTELYDDLHPQVWNSNVPGRPDWNLCGQPIRHHKFPDNVIVTGGTAALSSNHYKENEPIIRIMGVRFDDIALPVDNNGVLIPGIKGYEILRGARKGHKSVLYKGMINNMFKYTAPKLVASSESKEVLYANYPFNDLRPDPFISMNANPTYNSGTSIQNYTPNSQYSKKHFTFHSPDTMFFRPILIDDELKIYGALHGRAQGSYFEASGHPKHKFLKNIAAAAGIVAGIGYALAKVNGTRNSSYSGFGMQNDPMFLGISTSTGNALGGLAVIGAAGAEVAGLIAEKIAGVIDALAGTSTKETVHNGLQLAQAYLACIPMSGLSKGEIVTTYEDQNQVPGVLRIALAGLGNPVFMNYISDGCHAITELIFAVGRWHQFALQSASLCNYETFYRPAPNNRRRKINDSRYLDRGLFDYTSNYLVNNLRRNETVILDTVTNVENTHALYSTLEDKSRLKRYSNCNGDTEEEKQKSISNTASSHYVAYKTRNQNQYGQINSVQQVIASYGPIESTQSNSGTIFGGDTYIGKYSEKNTLYYFDKWLDGEPNGSFLAYDKHRMFDYTAFWVDTDPWDINEFVQSIPNAFAAALPLSLSTFFESLQIPSDKYCVDRSSEEGVFLLKNAHFYLFSSGVKNFYVETEINIDLRDWDDDLATQHYPIFSNLKQMFNHKYINSDNYYKFDQSLSVIFTAQQNTSWGKVQDFDYNPNLSESCYTFFPNRALYSLPLVQGTTDLALNKNDPWKIWLPQNFADFTSAITNIKSIDKTGAIIFFKSQPPGKLPGVSQFKATQDTLTIGDGLLWSRMLQTFSNTDGSFEYGSCQNRLSVLNCPAGIYWMCMNQGKIFSITDGIKEISMNSNRFWLNAYLPYKLILDFPTYSVLDNPVRGIGCQTIYDNEYMLIYFCKKDYRVKPNLPVSVEYIEGTSKFSIGGMFSAETGDPRYFDDCSWTLSYDPKIEKFISFHDWHPDLNLGAKNTFLTTKKNTLWKHNITCQSFCNYYNTNYPFEIEYQIDNKMQVATTSNVEYYIESFVYNNYNCNDRFHVLDHGFNQAIVYNSEQVSGLLNLNITPKNNLPLELSYPKVNLTSIDILFSKEEQKYRFNQFWDITKDRGEFTSVQEVLLKTENNGYVRNLNPNAINYSKQEFQRKKFRHYDNRVRLIRTINNNVEIIVSLTLSNQKISFR